MLGNVLLLTFLAQSGSWNLHLISHQIGEERYTISKSGSGMIVTSQFEYSDRGTKRPAALTMHLGADYSPRSFELKGRTTQSLTVNGGTAEFHDGDAVRSVEVPRMAFAGIGLTPVAQQMLMMRYWAAHGRPKELPIVPDRPARTAVIRFAAHDQVNGVKLDRFTVSGLAFGSEVLWL